MEGMRSPGVQHADDPTSAVCPCCSEPIPFVKHMQRALCATATGVAIRTVHPAGIPLTSPLVLAVSRDVWVNICHSTIELLPYVTPVDRHLGYFC